MPDFPSSAVRSYDDLIVALRAVKEFLGISNETLEEIAGLTRGHADKVLGPSREKRIGPQTLPLILGALGVRLRLEPDPDQVRCVAARWIKRNEQQVRHRRGALWFADDGHNAEAGWVVASTRQEKENAPRSGGAVREEPKVW